ncbi:hypothetical protein PFNF135_01919 [Plasmodium falciparum NF135/5.C10]|uniref:Rieske domain-containing protein n=3 Tax=Plasmodium falciparum TaxID=5833 RepID=A0A0L7M898_PLAF4|nr:hypothetical protein PFFVO_01785 [Plasmodium falciparum Vietnam Oak-Knoll (FVO)]ETW43795.1 hypothetical protein PFNF135_01919 [Plasmodium falciparum NF135/5.C10]KOB89046.1 hypothetical protein PFDG_04108 [Plasmodium falciparum Dd2]
MRRNLLSLNGKISTIIKSDKLKTRGISSYNILKNNINVSLERKNKNRFFFSSLKGHQKIGGGVLNSYDIFLIISLLAVPTILNNKFGKMSNSIANCSNVEKVFLIKSNELQDGEMKEIKVHEEKDTVLLVRVNNKYYCLGPKCPHYSAPLKSGVLTNEYITCPWHDAKFDIKTGECINGPSFDDIPKYEVVIEGNEVYALLPKKLEIFEKKRICECKGSCEKKNILIVGGGAATLGALETFLKLGYNGKLIICSKDAYKPYDRPTLSKNVSNCNNCDELYEEIKLKEDSYYNKSNIIYKNNVYVEKVDTENKKAHLNNGEIINFDKILITTGISPSPSPMKNMNLDNLFTLHNLSDNIKIGEYAKEGSKCVIIGSSFIACELSSALKKKNVNVTLISKDDVPFYGSFGEKIGNIVLNILKEKNIKFYPSMHPTEYIIDKRFFSRKSGNIIHGVRLNNGEVINCDYVIEALGCIPNSDFLDEKYKNVNNFIEVDKHFKVKNSDNMYAAGDVCTFPYFLTDEMVNVCHWNVAIQQGRIAAHNMLRDDKKEFNFIPFFNTNIFGKNFRYSGYVKNYDKIIYEGDLLKHNFIGYFVKNDKVASIITLGNNKMASLNECMAKNKVPKVYELEGGLKNSDSMIASLKI